MNSFQFAVTGIKKAKRDEPLLHHQTQEVIWDGEHHEITLYRTNNRAAAEHFFESLSKRFKNWKFKLA